TGTRSGCNTRPRVTRGARCASKRRVGRALPLLLAAGARLHARRVARWHRAAIRARRVGSGGLPSVRRGDRTASCERRVHDSDADRRPPRLAARYDVDGGLAHRTRIGCARDALYIEYACRDDYGALAAQTSAWAGIHYFASRVHDEQGPLTW